MRAWVALASAVGALGCSCKDHYCGESPSCPAMFAVHTWCGTTKKCTLAGGPVDCDEEGCKIPRGKTLRVPLSAAIGDVGTRQELLVVFVNVKLRDLTPSLLEAKLNGSSGAHLEPVVFADLPIGWAPFPPAPLVLDVSHDDLVMSDARIELSFHDYACRRDHPPEVCPL